MTVRSIVEMFETMAASSRSDTTNHSVKSIERRNVYGLVTYFDGLAEVEESVNIVATKTVRLIHDEHAVDECEPQRKEVEQEQEEQKVEERDVQEQEKKEEAMQEQGEEEKEEQEQVDSQASNQESNEASAVLSTSSLPDLKFVSKIPQPKSRKLHQIACSVRKPMDTSRANQPMFVPPPTPVSTRARAPAASYAAFVARIEHSQSRLLDFEKDERWLGQLETMKSRVETLRRRNHIALAREVDSSPRKSRSMSECSGVSTASTASMSSMDTLEVSCQ